LSSHCSPRSTSSPRCSTRSASDLMAFEIVAPLLTFAAVFGGAWLLGGFMVRLFQGERTFLHPVLRPVERAVYRVSGIDEQKEQTWVAYTVSMLLVTVISLVVTYLVLRYQDRLPLQDQLN